MFFPHKKGDNLQCPKLGLMKDHPLAKLYFLKKKQQGDMDTKEPTGELKLFHQFVNPQQNLLGYLFLSTASSPDLLHQQSNSMNPIFMGRYFLDRDGL